MENAALKKQELRRAMQAARGALSVEEAARRSAALREAVRRLPGWETAREVMLFWPLGREADLGPLLDELTGRGVRVLLPRCRADQPGCMDVARVCRRDELCRLSHGIMEPDPGRCPPVQDPAPDIILVPGLAFDRRGLRLGFGGGYYDRFLAGPGCARSLVAGVCYDFQLVDALPAEPWDRPVQVVVTESRTVFTGPGQDGL